MFRFVVAICCSVLLSGPALAETRVALVIGNGAYAGVGGLANPGRDAKAIADLLAAASFDVSNHFDLDRKAMRAALKSFSTKAATADVAVVYFAGHGMEIGGSNWLLPVDATLASSDDIEDEAIRLDAVRAAVADVRRLRVVILDACRDNPFTAKMKLSKRSMALGRGLARVEPETAEVIAYAAAEGHTASDGSGSHSPYTAALLRRLTTPGVDVRRLFGFVYDDVRAATAADKSGPQEPAVYFPKIGGNDVVLVDTGAAPAATQVPVGRAEPRSEAAIRLDYEHAKDVDTREAWTAFLSAHPDGFYATLARQQLAKTSAKPASSLAAAPQPSSGKTPGSSLVPCLGNCEPARPAGRETVVAALPTAPHAATPTAAEAQDVAAREPRPRAPTRNPQLDERLTKLPFDKIRGDRALFDYALTLGAGTFEIECTSCHRSPIFGGRTALDLRNHHWSWGTSIGDIQRAITTGIRSLDQQTLETIMPAFGTDGLLKPAEIADLADHVLSLSSSAGKARPNAAGVKLYADNCSACHGAKGTGDREVGAPDLTDAEWIFGATRQAIIAQITEPRHGIMPAFRDKLDEAATKAVSLFVEKEFTPRADRGPRRIGFGGQKLDIISRRGTVGTTTANAPMLPEGAALMLLPVDRTPSAAAAISPDGRRIVAGLDTGTVELRDAATGRVIRSFAGHPGVVRSVAFAPDGRSVLSGGDRGSILLHDVSTGQEIHRFAGIDDRVTAVAVSPDGRLALSGTSGGRIDVWDMTTGFRFRDTLNTKGEVDYLAVSPDGRTMLPGGWDRNTVSLLNSETGVEIRRMGEMTGGATAAAFSPDGRFVLSGGGDGRLRLWEAATGKEVRTIVGHALIVTSVAFSADGRTFLSSAADNTVALWDATTGTEIRRFRSQFSYPVRVAFGADGKTVTAAVTDGVVETWNVATEAPVGIAVTDAAGHHLAVTADGKVSTDDDPRRWLKIERGNEELPLDPYVAVSRSATRDPR